MTASAEVITTDDVNGNLSNRLLILPILACALLSHHGRVAYTSKSFGKFMASITRPFWLIRPPFEFKYMTFNGWKCAASSSVVRVGHTSIT